MMADSLLDLTVAELNVYASQLAESESEFDTGVASLGDPKDVAFLYYWIDAVQERRTSTEQLVLAGRMIVYPEMAANVAELLPEKHDKIYNRVGRPRENFKAWVCAAAFNEASTTERFKGAAVAKAAERLGIPDQLDVVEKGHARVVKAMSRLPANAHLPALEKIRSIIREIEIRSRDLTEAEKHRRFAARHTSPISAEKFARR